MGKEYVAWYDPLSFSIFIQEKGNFEFHNKENQLKVKLSNDGKVQLISVNGRPVTGSRLIPEAWRECWECFTYELFCNNQEIFAKTLSFIKANSQDPVNDIDTTFPFTLDAVYRTWWKWDSAENSFIFTIQKEENYLRKEGLNRLEFKVNHSSKKITSIHIDGISKEGPLPIKWLACLAMLWKQPPAFQEDDVTAFIAATKFIRNPSLRLVDETNSALRLLLKHPLFQVRKHPISGKNCHYYNRGRHGTGRCNKSKGDKLSCVVQFLRRCNRRAVV